MNKVYPNRINWENWPSDETPINETNLNKMDYALYELDDEVISLDTTKASKMEVAPLIANVTFDETTGIFTFTKKDGSTFTLDTLLEKIIVNFSFDRDTQKIILIMEDGTQEEIDLSAFIAEYEFVDSDTIAFTLLENHKITAKVKAGSITEDYLQPNYLADIKVAQAKAESAQAAAETAQNNAEDFAKEAEAHAVGQRGGVDVGEDDPTYHNNSKYYAEKSASDGEAWAKGTRGGVPVPSTDETYHNSAEYWAGQAQAAAQGGVVSFNGRNGIVNPAQDDYTIGQIKATGTTGQVPTLNADGKLEMADPQGGGSDGHTILDSEGTALAQQDSLQFVGATVTNDSENKRTVVTINGFEYTEIEYEDFVKLTEEEQQTGNYIVLNWGGDTPSGGGGHTIQDQYGNILIQRSTLQFTGDVEVTDDSENEKTIVNIPKATEITWAKWQELSDEQKETGKWDITGVPGADGTINAELLTKLWENPDPSVAFAAQEITLSSDDYDFLIFVTSYTTIILKKGHGSIISCVTASAGTILGYNRSADFTTDTKINITDCLEINPTTKKISNTDMLPIAIYGFKSTVTLKVNAIAMDVSTSASKCMLDDGRSVEEVMEQDFTNSIFVKSVVGDKATHSAGTGVSSGEFELEAGWYILVIRLASPPYNSSATTRYQATLSKKVGSNKIGLHGEVKYYESGAGLGLQSTRCIYLGSGTYELEILVQLGSNTITDSAALHLYKLIKEE